MSATEIRATCPECDSITQSGNVIPKFYVNVEKQVGYCHHCQFSGPVKEDEWETLNIVDIKERQPFDKAVFETLVTPSDRALSYLEKRFPSLSTQAIERGQLRYNPTYDAVAIPTYNVETRELIGVKYRFVAPSGDLRYISQEASEFGGYWLDGSEDKLIITEGEFDALSAKLMGFTGTVLALQTNRLSQETVSKLKKFKNVFLCLDNDKAGLEGRAQVKSLIPFVETKDVTLPTDVKDLNELLTKYPQESKKLLRKATQLKHEKDTVTFEDRIEEIKSFLKDKTAIKGSSTGWPSLDRILAGGLRRKEFTVLNGFFKRGKTTFLNNLTLNMLHLGTKVAISSFEMDTDTQSLPNYLSLIFGQDVTRLPADQVDEVLGGIVEIYPELQNLCFNNSYGKVTRADIEQWIRFVVEQGHELIVLDHSGFMLEEPGNANENEKIAEMFARLAKELNIHLICVVQAPKPAKDKSGSYIQDLSGMTAHGGTAWAKFCTNFITIKVVAEEAKTIIEVSEASRNRHVLKGEPVNLFYDRETGKLFE